MRHSEKDRTYVYYPITDQDKLSQGVLKEVIESFFDGSAVRLITTLMRTERLTEKDIDQIRQMVLEYKEENSDD